MHDELFDKASTYAREYLQTVDERRVFPDDDALKGLEELREELPANGEKPEVILDLLNRVGSQATVAHTGGRYFGFVNGGAFPVSLAVKWLADVWDQNAAMYATSPIAAVLEQLCEEWLVKLLGLPAATAVGLVGGTATANLTALAAARNSLLQRAGWNVASRGLFGAPEIRVIVGAQAHATIYKALSILGMGRDRVISVDADAQGRIVPEKIPPLDERTLLILQAGNVNSGAFDPFEEILPAARDAHGWVHVDGAFGLWAAAVPSLRPLTAGMEHADSWAADAHKTLNAPYDCGLVFCRHRDVLADAMRASASYLMVSEQRDNMSYTPDMSRRARGIELWATLKYLGRTGVTALVERLCTTAQQLSAALENAGFAILNDVCFNQVLVCLEPPELTQGALKALQASGEIWCGGAIWNGRPVIRLSVCSWKTGEKEVERTVRAFVTAREEVKRP